MKRLSMFYRLEEVNPSALPELSVVRLVRDVTTDEGGTLPAGSSGTIVGTFGDGEAYDVEFIEPLPALVTLAAAAIVPDTDP